MRVVLASSLVTALIAGGAVLANARNQRSNASQRTALAARADGITTGHALTRYWREREAMNEYLVLRHATLQREIAQEAVAFDWTLGQIFVDTPREQAFVSKVRAANDAFIAAFERDRERGRGPGAAAAALRDMDRLAARVSAPLGVLSTIDANESRTAQRAASNASAQARSLAIAAALLFLVAMIFFSISAIRLFRRLGRQNRDLKVLDGLKDDFVASVSHELRTPLTSIQGYLELILDEDTGPLNDQQRRFLSIVNRSSDRLLRLVGDLLFVAQLDAASLHLESSPVPLAGLVEQAVDAARPAAAVKGLTLTAAVSGVPDITGDEARLAQLLDNLIANAIKFTDEGAIAITLTQQAGHALIEVADSGMGIPAGEEARLFERFYRTQAANTQAIQGSGLGLAIAKAIAEGHGGTIEYQSVENEGTTFRVRLPLPTPVASRRSTNAAVAG